MIKINVFKEKCLEINHISRVNDVFYTKRKRVREIEYGDSGKWMTQWPVDNGLMMMGKSFFITQTHITTKTNIKSMFRCGTNIKQTNKIHRE